MISTWNIEKRNPNRLAQEVIFRKHYGMFKNIIDWNNCKSEKKTQQPNAN